MPAQDVVVIGGGIIGCAVARELARRGAAVRMFEARTIGAGATQASAGILAPYIEGHDRGPLFDLGLRSLAMYDDFVRDVTDESGLTVEYRRCGTLEVAADAAAAARLRQSAAADPQLQWLDPVRGPRPGSRRSRRRSKAPCWRREHGYVAVPSLMDALAWAALRHGVQIEAAHRVTGDSRRRRRRATISTEDGTSWSAGRGRDRRGQLVGPARCRRSARRRRCVRCADSCCGCTGAARRSAHRLGTGLLRRALAGPDRAGRRHRRGRRLRRADDGGGGAGSAGRGLRAAAGSVARDVPRSARRPAPGDAGRPAIPGRITTLGPR